MKHLLFFFCFLCVTISAFSQKKVITSGIVVDAQTKEVLISALVYEVGTTNAVYTNEAGRFSIFTNGLAELEFSYVSYESQKTQLINNADTTLYIQLKSNTTLETVLVISQQQSKPNTSSLSVRELTNIPALGGKADVLKTAQLLPGVQSQNEGSSLLNVRGGDPGQNLYLIDNVPLIYVNHLGGFTSVFNPEIINSIDIYKGSFPSQYGGKLSSILNITQRTGDANKTKGTFSIGVSDVAFTVEGPTKVKNTQFILSCRKTLLPDVFLYGASAVSRGNDVRLSYGYHDLNGKFTWEKDKNNTLVWNMYYGDDYLNYWGKKIIDDSFRYTNAWGNKLISFTWNNSSLKKIQISHIISYTHYRTTTKLKFNDLTDTVTKQAYTKDLSSKSQVLGQSLWKYTATPWWRVNFGIQSSFNTYIPDYTYNSYLSKQKEHSIIYGHEATLFADNIFKITPKIQLTPGLRAQYNIIAKYKHTFIEPRVQLQYKMNSKNSFGLQYMQVYQNSQMLFTSGSIVSNEIWIPASKTILPSEAKHYSLSWNGALHNGGYTPECNIYYKKMDKLLAFKDGYSNIKGDELWEQKIAKNGEGISYGIELFVRKQTGNWQGFTSYSYSHTSREFDEINNGKEYIFDYDRPHTISISAMRTISNKWSVGGTWVFQSGLPYTPVIGRYSAIAQSYENEYYTYETLLYGARNSARIKPYHRLDIGATYKTKTKRNNSCEWNFSIYNVYNRKNPYYYYYNHNNSGEFYTANFQNETAYKSLKLYQISFFPIIPSVSYKVYFDGENYAQQKQAKQQTREQNKNRSFGERFKAWITYE